MNRNDYRIKRLNELRDTLNNFKYYKGHSDVEHFIPPKWEDIEFLLTLLLGNLTMLQWEPKGTVSDNGDFEYIASVAGILKFKTELKEVQVITSDVTFE